VKQLEQLQIIGRFRFHGCSQLTERHLWKHVMLEFYPLSQLYWAMVKFEAQNIDDKTKYQNWLINKKTTVPAFYTDYQCTLYIWKHLTEVDEQNQTEFNPHKELQKNKHETTK
jgi:hypothetical protein